MQELLSALTSQLGIDEGQAKGGAGLLFKMAKEKLGGDDFGKVTDALGNLDDLLDAAPDTGGGAAALLGKMASALGGEGLGDIASLAGGFKDLKLDSDMVGKFIPIVLDFVQGKGGDSLVAVLRKVLQ